MTPEHKKKISEAMKGKDADIGMQVLFLDEDQAQVFCEAGFSEII
jgi:hypothetical protein